MVKASRLKNPILVRTTRRAAQAGVIIFVFYMVLIGGFVLGVREYSWRTITLVILGLVWGGWYLYKLIRRTNPANTQLEYPLLIMLGVAVLTTVFSTDPRLSAGRASLNLILVISLYFTLDWISNEWRAELLIKALLLTGGVVCLVGLVEYWQWYGGTWISPVSWRETGINWAFNDSLRIKSVLHNPNYLAYYLILPIGLAFYQVFTITGWGRRLWTGYLLILIITMILTQSRGGLMGAFGTIVVAVVLFLWSQLGRVSLLKILKKPYNILLTGVFLGLIGFLLFPVVTRTDINNVGTLNFRDDIWQGAVDIFLAHPILGAGPATFPSQYMLFRNLDGHTAIFTHAHNMWLTIAAEYGILGVLSVGVFFVILGKMVVNYLRYTPPAQWSVMLLVGVSILVGQGLHNLVDDFMEFPIFTWFTVMAVALCIWPLQNQIPSVSSGGRRTWLFLVGIGLLIITGCTLWYGRAFAVYDQARIASQNGDWLQATQWLEQAAEFDPNYRFYRQQLALAYGQMAQIDESYLLPALTQQEQVYQQNPGYSPNAAYLSCLYWQSGKPDRAIELMQQAIATTPPKSGGLYSYHLDQFTFSFNLGYYLESAEKINLATPVYKEILQSRPQLSTSTFWQGNSYRRHLRDSLPDSSQAKYQAMLDLLTKGKLLQAEQSIKEQIAAVSAPESAPPYYYLWGKLAELKGDILLAEQNYKRAIDTSLAIRTDYANLVGQRQPLAVEKPFCLLIPYPAEYLSKPTQALANLRLSQGDFEGAVAIYQTLLRHEPYNLTVKQELEKVLADHSR